MPPATLTCARTAPKVRAQEWGKVKDVMSRARAFDLHGGYVQRIHQLGVIALHGRAAARDAVHDAVTGDDAAVPLPRALEGADRGDARRRSRPAPGERATSARRWR